RGVVWTDPYRFNEGEWGITAALALRPAGGGEAVGVFTADYLLHDISRFLAAQHVGRTGRAYVLSRRGEVIASPAPTGERQSDRLLEAALEASPGAIGRLSVGQALPLRFERGGVRYAALFQLFDV